MTKPYLRDLQSDATELLKEQGEWVVAGVETHIAWPKQPQVVPFEGLDFILRPQTEQDAATVCLNAAKAGISSKDARDLVLRFGSALSWTEGNAFEVVTWVGGSHAVRLGRGQGRLVQDFLDPQVLPAIPSEEAATALAFYREGLSSDNHFYGFLSLYKVVAFIHRDGKQRGMWIEEVLPKLEEPPARERIQALEAEGAIPAEYLRDHGRHAIAHAEKDVFVNPDNLVDHERIYRDLPVMKALARRAIEERFGLYSRSSRNAPKETFIPGLERAIGAELIEKLLNKHELGETHILLPDRITALVRWGNRIIPFCGLYVDALQRWENGLGVRLLSEPGTLMLQVGIDFRERKLVYEPEGNCGAALDKSSRSSIEQYSKLREFNWLYYGNGQLELWDEERDELLGKTEAYIPLNMYLDHQALERARSELQQLLDAAIND